MSVMDQIAQIRKIVQDLEEIEKRINIKLETLEVKVQKSEDEIKSYIEISVARLIKENEKCKCNEEILRAIEKKERLKESNKQKIDLDSSEEDDDKTIIKPKEKLKIKRNPFTFGNYKYQT